MSAVAVAKALPAGQDLPAGVAVERDISLASYTTMKVGGPAEYFATVQTTDQLLKLVRWARKADLPYYILGGGSNVLISDAGIKGLVIHNRCRAVRVDQPPCCEVPQDERPFLVAESGAAMAGVARQSIRAGLTGLEWAVSVPGTVGGAVVGNAGAHGGEIKDNLAYAMLIDGNGEVVEYGVDDFAYAYRDSSIKRLRPIRAGFKPVVLSANFRLPLADTERDAGRDTDDGAARAAAYLDHRRRTQPVEPSLGSTFVNPPGDFAGRLIEEAGLKGTRVGGVEVSMRHANFIVNPGGVGQAKADEVLALIEQIQQTVHARFGVRLTTEVQLVGEWSPESLERIGFASV